MEELRSKRLSKNNKKYIKGEIMNDGTGRTVPPRDIIYCDHCHEYKEGSQDTGGAYCYDCGCYTIYERWK